MICANWFDDGNCTWKLQIRLFFDFIQNKALTVMNWKHKILCFILRFAVRHAKHTTNGNVEMSCSKQSTLTPSVHLLATVRDITFDSKNERKSLRLPTEHLLSPVLLFVYVLLNFNICGNAFRSQFNDKGK